MIDGPGDPDHDGFVEHFVRMKRAHNRLEGFARLVFHATGDGGAPIALCEVQLRLCKRLAARTGSASMRGDARLKGRAI